MRHSIRRSRRGFTLAEMLTATSDISGTVASVGARLLEGTARRLTEEFWTDFARRVGES